MDGMEESKQERPGREEILARSRRENRMGDERERRVRIEGESFSLLFVFLMGLALLALKRAHGLPDEDVLVMFWTACASGRIYRLVQRRDTSDFVTLLICLAFLGYNLVKFFQIAG